VGDWLIVAAALVGVEVFTLTFPAGPLAVAAALAALVAILGGGAVVQIIVFAVGAIGSLAIVRPIAMSHLPAPSSRASVSHRSAPDRG
jgi:membrane protein implicated in regulation of membrane protease activity